MKRIAFLNFHGLGDSILLTATLKCFKEANPDYEISLFVLKRFGDTAVQLLSGLEFIKDVRSVLPNPWDTTVFTSYNAGLTAMVDEGVKYAKILGIDVVKPIYCFREGSQHSLKNHKLFRFAKELGIKYRDRTELRPLLTIKTSFLEKAHRLLDRYPKPYTLLHLQGGNEKKSLSYNQIPFYNWEEGTTFEIGQSIVSQGNYHINLGLPEMEFTKAIVASVDRVVAIDSIVMHMGFALEVPTTAIFTMTPITQVIPLWCPFDPEKITLIYTSGCEEGLSKVESEVEGHFKK